MTIGIDCRLYNQSGVGRYIRNLINNIPKYDKKNSFVLFLSKECFDSQEIPKSYKRVLADVKWHSLREQVLMPRIFLKESLDVLFVPYINPPIFYPKPFVFTIHDLIPLKFVNPQVSSLPTVFYYLKVLFLYLILFVASKRAKKIIAVSNATRNEAGKMFKIPEERITSVYNSLSESFLKPKRTASRENYILYVGNFYPHKNIELLLKAFVKISKGSKCPDLILAGKEDLFCGRLKKQVPEGLKHKVRFIGQVTDVELLKLYRGAKALVAPSFYEGFGFVPLEALSQGCPAICSNIPVFREVFGESAFFFNPMDEKDLVSKLRFVLDDKNKKEVAEIVKKSPHRKFTTKRFVVGTLEVLKYSGLPRGNFSG